MFFFGGYIKTCTLSFCRNISNQSIRQNATALLPTLVPCVQRPERSGVMAVKKGMTSYYDAWGVRVPCTIMQLQDTQVCQVKTETKDGYNALQIGVLDRRPKTVSHPLRVHFRKLGVPPKRVVREFMVPENALLPTGFALNSFHFVPGQYVDVRGTTIGKGFQGGMKRWGFKGLPASHGVSRAHRSVGSTGCRHDPGRIWPGKKMPGRMGGKNATALCLLVVKVDKELNTVWVRGCVPGHLDSFVEIKDARKRINKAVAVPFPTYIPGVHTPEAIIQHQVEASALLAAQELKGLKASLPGAKATGSTAKFTTTPVLVKENVLAMQVVCARDPIARRCESKN